MRPNEATCPLSLVLKALVRWFERKGQSDFWKSFGELGTDLGFTWGVFSAITTPHHAKSCCRRSHINTCPVSVKLEEMVYFWGEEERVGNTVSERHPNFLGSYSTLESDHWTVWKSNLAWIGAILVSWQGNPFWTGEALEMAYPLPGGASPRLQNVFRARWYDIEHFVQLGSFDWRPIMWCIRGICVQLPKKEIQRVANNSRTRRSTGNFSKCFWSVFRSSLTSQSVVLILQHPIGRGPLYWKNQQKTGYFDGFSVDFDQTNTSRIPNFAKKMDTESYSQIGGEKFRTRFCGQLFSRLLQNGASCLFGKRFPTTWRRLMKCVTHAVS